MSLNIKNEETVRLVRELADELDVSLTAAVTDAVRARLEGIHARQRREDGYVERVLAIASEMRALLGDDYLAQDFDALLYDEKGLPR